MKESEPSFKRYNPDKNIGLTRAQVKERVSQGLVNSDKSTSLKSDSQIIKDNLFTLFNFINLILAIAILFVGSYRNLMFMGVVTCNAFIGIFQEIKAKNTINRLNLINSSEACVIRDGEKQKINIKKIVLDDILEIKSGEQIVADCIILEGKCEVNESLLTGEPDLIPKKQGDTLLSGSYIVSGSCKAKTENVGEKNFSSRILDGLKFIKKTKSEIMSNINIIIKFISIAIIPVGALLFYRQLVSSGYNYSSSIVSTAAALTGMIPEGLVLLTSSVLAIGIIRLSRRRILVQDLYCLETLARVDTLCLDKTGTITEGTFEMHEVVPINGFSKEDAAKALKILSSNLNDANETFKTIQANFLPDSNYAYADEIYPFSSEKKWSGIHLPNEGSYVLGASEFVFGEKQSELVKEYSKNYRVLALGCSSFGFENKNLPKCVQPVALVLLKDKIRFKAEKTLNFFARQGVNLKIISGDDPVTVSQIGKRVNIKNSDLYIDTRTLKTDKQIYEAAEKYTVFGRVTPSQKQKIIKALKSQGHTVAMVGDGINDVLAMKESDCSIAMASGSNIARNVAHLVLLSSDFAAMPYAVAEGRKAINNLQRSSSLFLIKTIYSFILSILFFIISAPYPFIPIQMTLISSLTIGLPSFILGLEPNKERIHGNLFRNIISKALPAAISIVSTILICVGIYSWCGISQSRYSTLAVVSTGFLGILTLYKISLPLNKIRKNLLWFVIISFCWGVIKFSDFFKLESLNWINILILIPLMIASAIVYKYMLAINWENMFKFKRKKT